MSTKGTKMKKHYITQWLEREENVQHETLAKAAKEASELLDGAGSTSQKVGVYVLVAVAEVCAPPVKLTKVS